MHRPGPSAGAVTLGLVLAGSGSASAQDVSLSRAGSGARAAGMADAFVAVSDDGTAASWNPAGLAQLRQPEFSFVYALSERGLRLSGLRSPDDRVAYALRQPLRSTSSSVDFASAAVPFSIARKPTTLQVSWRRLYQLDNVFGGDVDRYVVGQPGVAAGSAYFEDRLTGSIDVISLAGAMKLTARTAVGGSIDFWRGGWTERVSAFEDPGPQGPAAFLDSAQEVRMRGHNATVGLLLTYPAWNAALVYHAPFWSAFRGHLDAHSTSGPAEGYDVRAARWRLPRSIGAGAAWRMAAPRWMVAAALTHDEWTGALVDVQGGPGPANFFDGAPPAVSSTRDTVSVNVGAEHLFVQERAVVPVRVGVGWEPQGAMDPVTRDPVDYVLVSAGTGYNTNRVKLDLAVQYRQASFHTSQNFTVASAMAGGLTRDALGRGKSHEWRIKVSAIYRVQDIEKLKGILRKIFG